MFCGKMFVINVSTYKLTHSQKIVKKDIWRHDYCPDFLTYYCFSIEVNNQSKMKLA